MHDNKRHRVEPYSAVSHCPLVAHVIHRLAVGGLENGVVNLINHMPPERYRHAIVCLTEFTNFRDRLHKHDIPVIALHRRDGHDWRSYLRMWTILRSWKPAIVHTRNLPALEYLMVAALAGPAKRVHGEHGRDMYDLDGSSPKYRLFRRALAPVVHRFTAVSLDLSKWLIEAVGVHPTRVVQIYNGVNIDKFRPRTGIRPNLGPAGFMSPGCLVVGTVGRLQAVKDQVTLVRAFVLLVQKHPEWRDVLRLLIVGDGPLRDEAVSLLRGAGMEPLAWLPGERSDVPELLQCLDLFVLPSRAEGISNTMLEAMASGLPVIATRVGGNSELVLEGKTGMLVPPADPEALANAMGEYIQDRSLILTHGSAARMRVERQFSMDSMVRGYLDVYDQVLAGTTAH